MTVAELLWKLDAEGEQLRAWTDPGLPGVVLFEVTTKVGRISTSRIEMESIDSVAPVGSRAADMAVDMIVAGAFEHARKKQEP